MGLLVQILSSKNPKPIPADVLSIVSHAIFSFFYVFLHNFKRIPKTFLKTLHLNLLSYNFTMQAVVYRLKNKLSWMATKLRFINRAD